MYQKPRVFSLVQPRASEPVSSKRLSREVGGCKEHQRGSEGAVCVVALSNTGQQRASPADVSETQREPGLDLGRASKYGIAYEFFLF